jgi:hypothetical protein
MKPKMNATEMDIHTMDMYGSRIHYIIDPSSAELFFHAKDISRALKGYCVRTNKLPEGQRAFFKGETSRGKAISASTFITIDGLDEVMKNVSDPKIMNTRFYLNWHDDFSEQEERVDKEAALKKMYEDTILSTKGACTCRTSCGASNSAALPKTARESELEGKVKELERTIQSLKLTKAIDSLNPAEAAFDRKWKVAMSMISEYCDGRISVLGTMEPKDVAAYRSHLWNDFILVEVDVKLGTTLRKEHKLTGKKYKQLVQEHGIIDGFFAVVSNLLKFGKG